MSYMQSRALVNEKINRDVTAENCGVARIKKALDKYAPGRYVFQEAGFCKAG